MIRVKLPTQNKKQYLTASCPLNLGIESARWKQKKEKEFHGT
jgi:hypothetical protein